MKHGGWVVISNGVARREECEAVPREEGVGMKVRTSVRSLKNKQGAQVVRRGGVVFVINKRDPRFKARQG
jgi:large subunit ribosomal protein L36